ncbi:MAG: NADH:flavin oxidoreductase [Lachnospiraceae bacterium]|nr:NADH:flavin oxidoreductase [Lachnospiraceae bacterium]
MNTDVLFQPIQIGNVELKNRIAMSPMNMGYTGPDGYASEQTNAWYATRARGGFGLIITECIVANPYPWRGSDSLNPLLCDAQDKYRFVSQVAETVHSYKGAKIFAQISPGWGRQGHPMPGHDEIAAGAPSEIPVEMDFRYATKGWMRQLKRLGIENVVEQMGGLERLQSLSDEEYAEIVPIVKEFLKKNGGDLYHVCYGHTPRELTIREIEQLEDFMVEQICMVYTLGFDGVEIHTPHGYLLHQFLSPRSNHREDLYGGSTENRCRVVTNIIERVRKKVGPDKALGCRISGEEFISDGLHHEEACKVVKLLADAGANFINVSQGSYEAVGKGFAPDGEGEFTRWAPGFKKASGGLPIITPNFMSPELAAEAVASGQTDIVSLGRQSIADPYWPAKVKEGRCGDIVKCARCQQCYMNLFESRWIRCSVNPTAGFEKYYPELWQEDGLMDQKARRFMDKRKDLPQI